MELTKKTKTSHKNKILQKKIPYAAAEPMRTIITGTSYVAGILYKQLTITMRKSWEVTFDLNPKLLTHPEQVKVLRFALKPHLEFLKTLDEVLAESSGESVKTA